MTGTVNLNPTTDEPIVTCEFSMSEVVILCNALNNAQLTFIGASGMVQNGIVGELVDNEASIYATLRDKIASVSGILSCRFCP